MITPIVFSLSVGFGALICFASYNPIKNNVQFDALFISLTNCGTSMFAGIVVYSILGYREVTAFLILVSMLTVYHSSNAFVSDPRVDELPTRRKPGRDFITRGFETKALLVIIIDRVRGRTHYGT